MRAAAIACSPIEDDLVVVSVMKTILVVDDDEAVRDVLREHLVDRGFSVETAVDAETALAAMNRRRPDVVLLDLHLPGPKSGAEILEEMVRRAPVIVVTALSGLDLARRMLQLGAFDFITKPFDYRYLDDTMAAALRYHRF